MRQLFAIIVTAFFLVPFSELTAQEGIYFHIRNYRSDLSVQLDHHKMHFGTIDSYGNFNNMMLPPSNKYLFQGQEYDHDIGMYYFPSRMYSPKNGRFMQVDPKSQYFSPYLFVNGDPVNVVDRNGKEGKPLFIYGENHDVPGGYEQFKQDIFDAFPDAHTVPLSDVVNGNVAPIPEWNGNVYICGHTGQYKGSELEIERGKNPSDFNTDGFEEGFLDDQETLTANVAGEDVGERLGELSIERGIPLNNVYVGGCQGDMAAEGIADGFAAKMKGRVHGLKARFFGSKKNVYSKFETKSLYKNENLKPIAGDFRVHLGPRAELTYGRFYKSADGKEGYYKMSKLNEKGRITGTLPSVDKNEFEGMIEGRIPKNVENQFQVFERLY